MQTINLSKDAQKFLTRVPQKQGSQLARALLSLTENPTPHDSKQLKGYPYMRIDVGEYRIIYELEGDTINVLLIGKRNDDEVYKKMKRK